jgi:predicted RND superfamily exporter protein
MGRLSSWLSAPAARWPRRVLALAAALAACALVPASRLRIDSDVSSLLPSGAPAARDYGVFLRTFGGFEKVFILVRAGGPRPADPAQLVEAAGRLAEVLAASPEVAEARSGRTEEDERFFFRYIAPRMPLLVDERTLAGLGARLTPEALGRRVAWMRQALSSPAGSALAPLFASDPLGLSESLLAASSSLLPMDPVSGAFLSRRGDAALVIVTPARAEIDPAGGRALAAELERAYAQVRREAAPELGPHLDFKAIGGPLYAAADEALLREDLTRTGSSTLAGVALVLLAGFEGVALPLAILAAVSFGVLWTAGATGLALGSVTVVGVGFTAALLGMGVDYGIHGGVRYRQLRLAGRDVQSALAGVFRENGPGVATAAFATAGGLAALLLAHFRPLREVGFVLATGVVATLLATATASAALAGLLPGAGRRPPAPPRRWLRHGVPALRAVVGLAVRHPRRVVVAALLATGAAGWGLARLGLSTDLRALRPADHPAAEAERLLVESFELGLDTFSVVARGRTLDEALDRAARVRALLRARCGERAEITSPSDWLVAGQRLADRLAVLRTLPLGRAADDLSRQLAAAGFRTASFAPALDALRAMGRGIDPGPPPPAAWPRWMSELVRLAPARAGASPASTRAAASSTPGRAASSSPSRAASPAPASAPGEAAVAVHVRLPLGGGGVEPEELARQLARVAPGVALASVPRVGAELKRLAAGDLRRSSGVALAVVAGVVLLSFRGNLGETLLAFLPLALGCLWTFGLWGAAGRSIDLLGIFTVPLLLSTGIILGAHAVHWRRLHPAGGFPETIEEVGLAMILATLTTAVGFGSLATSRVPGLRNAGILVAAGIVACMLAAFLVLPAVEALWRGGRRRPDETPR